MVNIVAEGHSTLERRLSYALGFQKDKERMELEIQNLNINMRKVKAAIGIA